MMNEREYLLVCVMEECSEIQKAASKALRFNLNKSEEIENEFIDLVALFEMLKFVTFDEYRIAVKKKKVRKFMKVSIETGRLRRDE